MGTDAGDDFNGTVGNPYAAPTAVIAEREIFEGLRKADRLTRLLAAILDGLVVSIPVFGIAISVSIYMGITHSGSASADWTNGDTALLVVVGSALMLYIAGFAAYQIHLLWKNGQTLGKKLMQVKIVRRDGSRADLPRLLVLRYLIPVVLGAVPFVGGLFSLVDSLFIFSEEKRCLHDLMADTIVIDT